MVWDLGVRVRLPRRYHSGQLLLCRHAEVYLRA